MIVNIEQRKGRLIISYINPQGEVAFMALNVPPSHQYSYNVTSKNRGLDNVQSWDGKPVSKVPSNFLTKHRIQEFFMDAGDKVTEKLFKPNLPKLYSCDIEVDVDDEGFPEASHARNRINTIAWSCYPEIIVFGLKKLNAKQLQYIQDEINKHIKPLGREYNFTYKVYENEANMLYDFLYNYARNAPLITGWNFWSYDWRYIYNRCKNLNMDISWMSPTKQWYDHKVMERNKKINIKLPQHKLIVDYLEIYKKWDRKIDVKENNTLDFVANAALNVSKVKYPGTFQDLYNKDFDKYVFYNAIDTILVEELDRYLKTMQTFLGLGNITKVEAMSAFSPIAMLEATLDRYAYKRNWVFPKTNKIGRREDYEGAFVFEPKRDLYELVSSFDFASLYPTIMRQFEISIENFIIKDKQYNPSDKEIKCTSGAVFDASNEPLLSEILTNYYGQRKDAKKIYMKAETEAAILKNILKERKNKINNQLT